MKLLIINRSMKIQTTFVYEHPSISFENGSFTFYEYDGAPCSEVIGGYVLCKGDEWYVEREDA